MRISKITRVMALVATAACSSDDERAEKQAQCDDLARDIREKATTQYNQPAEGACSNPTLKPFFDKACAALAKCEAELAEM